MFRSGRVGFNRDEMRKHEVEGYMITGVMRPYMEALGAEGVYRNGVNTGYRIPGRLEVEFEETPDDVSVVARCTPEGRADFEKVMDFAVSRRKNPRYISEDFHAMWLGD